MDRWVVGMVAMQCPVHFSRCPFYTTLFANGSFLRSPAEFYHPQKLGVDLTKTARCLHRRPQLCRAVRALRRRRRDVIGCARPALSQHSLKLANNLRTRGARWNRRLQLPKTVLGRSSRQPLHGLETGRRHSSFYYLQFSLLRSHTSYDHSYLPPLWHTPAPDMSS